MPNKRYALIVRLWQVQGNSMLDATLSSAESELTTEIAVTQPTEFSSHWRGSIQVVGESKLRYFDSLHEITSLLEQLVTQSNKNTNVSQ